jgi:hypothetical protein
MAYKPHERPIKPHTLDRRNEKLAQQPASKPVKAEHLDKAGKNIKGAKKPGS